MAKKTTNDHTDDHEASGHHEGSSVSFYIVIALVLGAITYVEFALVEHHETWFAALSNFSILALLIGLSIVKFVMVVMFFMHLQQDDRTFTGFFTSGMVIAVGTLFALSALFTVQSLARAQTPQAEGPAEAHGEALENEHGEEFEAEADPAHRFEYPAPKTLNIEIIDVTPPGQIIAGGSVEDSGGFHNRAFSSKAKRTAGGVPLAPPPRTVKLTDPFTEQPARTAQANTQQEGGQEGGQKSTQAASTPPQDGSGADGGGALLVDADTSAGETVFNGNCASCHQQTGVGVPGAFPPIAGHAPELALAEGGREYLANLLLYGLQGEIQVLGEPYNGVMPAWQQLSDDELASTLNYVLSSWGNADALPQGYPAFTADEIAAQRDAGLSADEVYELRQTLELP